MTPGMRRRFGPSSGTSHGGPAVHVSLCVDLEKATPERDPRRPVADRKDPFRGRPDVRAKQPRRYGAERVGLRIDHDDEVAIGFRAGRLHERPQEPVSPQDVLGSPSSFTVRGLFWQPRVS